MKNILLSLPILLLALPYIFLSTYGNSSFDSWIQYSIVVVSVIYVITGIYHLIKNKESNISLGMINYIGLFIAIFILLMEDALVYDRQTVLFFSYGTLSIVTLFELIAYYIKKFNFFDVVISLIVILAPPLIVLNIIPSIIIIALLVVSILLTSFIKKRENELMISISLLVLILTFINTSIIISLVVLALVVVTQVLFKNKKLIDYIFPILAVPFLIVILTLPNENIASFEVDTDTEYSVERNLMPMYEKYEDYFEVGISLPLWFVDNEEMSYIVNHHFNSITAESSMKPEYVLDENSRGEYTFVKGDPYIKFANENNKVVRGHTLNWYNQTPEWFFKIDYSDEGDFVSRDEMLTRLENYVKNVIKHYEGTELYAWDVVNEGMEIFSDTGYRESHWYNIIGPDYIKKTFEYARKYSEGTDLKLFYNDFNIYSNKKKQKLVYELVNELNNEGLIDGVGIQSHVGISLPTVKEIDETIKLYGELGLEIQITELDVSYYNTNTASSKLPNEDRIIEQAYRYNELFEVFKMNSQYITNVTFWGASDNQSWLNYYPTKRNNWPLLFDKSLKVKPAYYGIVDIEKLPKKATYSLIEKVEKSMRNILDID